MVDINNPKEILAAVKCGDIYSNDPLKAKQEYRLLVQKYHPDRNKEDMSEDIFRKIRDLYAQAEIMLASGQWEESNVIEFKSKEGKHKRLKYIKEFLFELGMQYVASSVVVYVLEAEHKRYFNNAIQRISSLIYENKAMEAEFKRYFPELIDKFETVEGKWVLAIKKSKDLVRLQDLFNYYRGRIEQKHVAGHTVVKSDGRRHVFSHFGSGSFNENNLTYLSSYFILNPMLFVKEYKVLKSKGVVPKVYIHKDCFVTFPCDVMINQMVEAHRDKNRHGSCGVGIYETIKRTSSHQKTTIGDIQENFDQLPDMIASTIQGYVPHRLNDLNIELTDREWELIRNKTITENYIDDLLFMLHHAEIVEDSIINEYDNIVFEGAQGLLLDADNIEYYPHLTPSNTGIKNAMQVLSSVDSCDISICYVSRSYFTRHGAGLLKTECDSTDLKPEGLRDKTNQTNSFQGNFRYRYFDVAVLKHSIERDLAFLTRTAKVELAITHLDETGGHLILGESEKLEVDDLLKILNLRASYISKGEKAEDIQFSCPCQKYA